MIIYAVVLSNYEPPELLGLYTSLEAAQNHVTYVTEKDDLNYRIIPWVPQDKFIPDEWV